MIYAAAVTKSSPGFSRVMIRMVVAIIVKCVNSEMWLRTVYYVYIILL